MRVLVAAESYEPRVNGVSNSVKRVVESLKLNNHQCIVLAAGSSFPAAGTNTEIRLPSLRFPLLSEYDFPLVTVSKIRRILIENNVQLVHLASPFYLGWLALLAARQLSIPVVAVFQTDVSNFAKFYKMPWLSSLAANHIKRIHQKSDLNLAPSLHSLKYLQALGVKQIEIWPRGVDTSLFSPNKFKQELRDQWDINKSFFIGYVGRLAPEKNIEDLKYFASNRFVKLVIIGDGPERSHLQKEFPEAIFTGRLSGEKLASAVASLDVVVASGRYETFCQVAQEAKSSGAVVFVPNKGASQELIDHEKNGFIYETENMNSISNSIEELICNNKLKREISRKARQSVMSCDWPSLTSQLMTNYQKLLDNRFGAKAQI